MSHPSWTAKDAAKLYDEKGSSFLDFAEMLQIRSGDMFHLGLLNLRETNVLVPSSKKTYDVALFKSQLAHLRLLTLAEASSGLHVMGMPRSGFQTASNGGLSCGCLACSGQVSKEVSRNFNGSFLKSDQLVQCLGLV